jgi:hypothetical protein
MSLSKGKFDILTTCILCVSRHQISMNKSATNYLGRAWHRVKFDFLIQQTNLKIQNLLRPLFFTTIKKFSEALSTFLNFRKNRKNKET